jgi:hypothetical protein
VPSCGPEAEEGSCCAPPGACLFEKALLARSAACSLAVRQSHGEREVLFCGSPVARINCATFAGMLRERAAFALRLPRSPLPLIHAQALRLQCGGLQGLREVAGDKPDDVHSQLATAQARSDGLADLPWARIVAAVLAWLPRRRGPRS